MVAAAAAARLCSWHSLRGEDRLLGLLLGHTAVSDDRSRLS